MYPAGKADSSALRVGTMKVSSVKNRPKAKESSPLSLSATATKENGKGIFPTGQDTKPGYVLALSLPMKANTWLAKNTAKDATRTDKTGNTRANFRITS